MINHYVFHAVKRLQCAMDLEEKTSISHQDRVEVGCDDVSCYKHESNDTTFDHTPNRSKVERMVFFCIFEVKTPLLIRQKG